MYAQKIEGEAWKGERLDVGKIDKMSGKLGRASWCLRGWGLIEWWGLDQQLGQLYELMQAIQKEEREGNDEGGLV